MPLIYPFPGPLETWGHNGGGLPLESRHPEYLPSAIGSQVRWASHARIPYSEGLPSHLTHSIPRVQIPYQSQGLQLLTFPRTTQSPLVGGGDRIVIYEPIDLTQDNLLMRVTSLRPGGARRQGHHDMRSMRRRGTNTSQLPNGRWDQPAHVPLFKSLIRVSPAGTICTSSCPNTIVIAGSAAPTALTTTIELISLQRPPIRSSRGHCVGRSPRLGLFPRSPSSPPSPCERDQQPPKRNNA